MTLLTNLTNATGIYDLGQFANDATSQLFWMVILIGLYIIMIVKLYKYGIERAIISSSFACLMISLPLIYLQWVNIVVPIVFAIGIAAGLAMLRMGEGG